MIHIYCGDGKGKTTAAMGLAARMAGRGKNVLIGQFFKDGSSGEIQALKTLPGIQTLHCHTVPGLFARMTEDQRAQAKTDYTAYLLDLLVLDEAISALNRGIIPEEPLLSYLQTQGQTQEIVLTGRNPKEELLALADYVTEMVKRKHPFDRGVKARRGVEF